LRGGRWLVTRNDKTKILRTQGFPAYLDKAIAEIDAIVPPKRWRFENNRWISDNWIIVEDGGRWLVRRLWPDGRLESATRQEFLSQDRARVWVELRRDRSKYGLRGPKPRAGASASAKLPDVRVTAEEKDAVVLALGRYGLSYSAFVRCAFEWAEQNLGNGWVIETDEHGQPFFTPQDPEFSAPMADTDGWDAETEPGDTVPAGATPLDGSAFD
jgi:hypothetical protein